MEVYGADLTGIEGQLIRFTATNDPNRRGVTLLGLAQKVVKEGIIRAAKAIETLDGDWSDILNNQGYTIDLTPAGTRKTSPGLDLPIAIMLLQASILQDLDTLKAEIERLERESTKPEDHKSKGNRRKRLLEHIEALVRQRERILKYRKRLQNNKRKYLLIGKLDIASGGITAPEHGMFSMIAAAKPGFTVVVPEDSEVHASIVASRKGIRAVKVADLQEVWNVILRLAPSRRTRKSNLRAKPKELTRHVPDLRDIEGVSRGKRAMAVALAGGHNILLVGPAGHGKGMLTLAATRLLPDLAGDEMFELNKIYSAKGELRENEVVVTRPYREVSQPTPVALFGGGNYPPMPGEVSLAHKGVLLIDEINNLRPASLIEGLRTVLNDRVHKVQRLHSTLEYPCNFILVAAMNPCRCGNYYHYVCPECGRTFFGPSAKCDKHPAVKLTHKCKCSRSQVQACRNALSVPLLQRIDLKVLVSSKDESQPEAKAYASSTIKQKIKAAREIQRGRYANTRLWDCNADVPDRRQFEKYTPALHPHVRAYVDEVFVRLDLPQRTQVKLLLVARTIADLEQVTSIRAKDVKEAADLMGLAHEYFGGMAY